MQVWNASVGGCLRAAEVRVLIDSDGGPANDLDGGDFIIQGNLGNIRTALAAEIFTGEVHILKEANATARQVRLTARTRIPPAWSMLAAGPDFELRLTPTIDPDSPGVIAPGLATDAPAIAKLFHQHDVGTRISNGTVLDPAMMRFADNGLDLIVLSSGFCGNEQT